MSHPQKSVPKSPSPNVTSPKVRPQMSHPQKSVPKSPSPNVTSPKVRPQMSRPQMSVPKQSGATNCTTPRQLFSYLLIEKDYKARVSHRTQLARQSCELISDLWVG
uniref:Uncharacterized protein n=1 Tax=Acrobeloides nanus TaxID=290746 RepID=A0A914CIX2_9BILA